MNIVLFSNDDALASFCREVLTETFGSGSNLEIARSGKVVSRDDLWLWDFIPGQSAVPGTLTTANWRRCLFLVDRKDLSALKEVVGTCDLHVLLKPIAPSALRSFLKHAETAPQYHGPEEHVNKLRVERDEMLQYLMQANLKLQEYNQERTNFLARSVHDFRAPLTAISGYCGLLLDEELGFLTPDQRDIIGRMQRSATRLAHITTSMLELSIPRHVGQKLNLENADMRECVDQALHEVALFLEDKGISIGVDVEQTPDAVLFDKSQVEQTLVNLLENACKFTPRNGTIQIRGYPFFWERRACDVKSIDLSIERRVDHGRAPNCFRVDVQDSGPGIPAIHASKIFEEYTSYSGGQDRSGSGLGLAICRRIMQLHGGRVWAESHSAGAVFSFVLPVQPVTEHAPGGHLPSRLAFIARGEDT